MQRAAGPGMILFALTTTFCSIDLVMSLDAHWFSTIFGVYYFASCVLAINSVLVLASAWLQGKGQLKKSITPEHYHDLGKMMFALHRVLGVHRLLPVHADLVREPAGRDGLVQRALPRGRLAQPVLDAAHRALRDPVLRIAVAAREAQPQGHLFWAFWVLGVVYLDMYWLIMPNYGAEHPEFGLMEILSWLGVAAAVVAATAFAARDKNLIPSQRPAARSVAGLREHLRSHRWPPKQTRSTTARWRP